MKRDYSGLQNGSDIRGVAIEGENPRTLGPEEAFCLSAAFGKWLSDRCGKAPAELKIAVGHDSRLSAGSLKEHVCRGLAFLGAKALDCGLASTPAMFMATQFAAYDCDGAIMITASHLPQDRNGFKYFSREGGLDKEDISAILKAAAQLEPGTEFPPAAAEKAELMSTYCAFLREKIEKEVGGKQPLAGLKIVVDAGNGAGGFYALNVLAPLGADVSGSQFLEPDGSFPNHQPNPENKEAMASICQAVLDNHADLGLIFDTDVDRSSAVDKNGREINRNAIVAMAAALIAPEHPGTTVVTDSITSDELTEYLEKCLGLKHLRFRRGYRNVINKAIELNRQGIDSQLAIETSGHAAYLHLILGLLTCRTDCTGDQSQYQERPCGTVIESVCHQPYLLSNKTLIGPINYVAAATIWLPSVLHWAKPSLLTRPRHTASPRPSALPKNIHIHPSPSTAAE